MIFLRAHAIPVLLTIGMGSLVFVSWQFISTPSHDQVVESQIIVEKVPSFATTSVPVFATSSPVVHHASNVPVVNVPIVEKPICPAPYRTWSPKALACSWSCAAGTRADSVSGECICTFGYKETGKDALGRRVCSLPPAVPPVAYSINWHTPVSKSISLARGSTLDLRWSLSGGDSRSTVRFALDGNETTGYSDFQSASASSGVISFVVEVPPGMYDLSVVSPVGVTRVVKVSVTGASQKVSSEKSTLDFDYYVSDASGETQEYDIVADGVCAADVYAYVADDFDFEMAGKKVTVTSSRGGVDSIFPDQLITDEFGEMTFRVLSQTIGDATLHAFVDGVQIGKPLILHVLNPEEGC